ncbi:MAG: amylo-alpha-1,6-glucosidase [Thermodesulfobacteriota bacterium]|nr:amylo-alpha-1,6-glucosidase [Thermodesulfobacteriota bacterium]
MAFRGDTQLFSLCLSDEINGTAWLRTNIGQVETKNEETIRQVLYDETRLHRDWFDIPMKQIDRRRFNVTVALCEVGHFEAKCFFLPDNESDPVWPKGSNASINVEPADTCCSNIVYNAFVRQFGPNKKARFSVSPAVEDCMRSLDNEGYTVIPRSGTFRDLISELDFIIGELGCRIIQLLPVHPTPTIYARMGRFGSPYAALSFTTVDPALSEFDPRATPTEQFRELVDAIHERNAKIIIDIAINHTGWAAELHDSHPEWLVRDTDGRIEAPGAWGVTWADLTKLEYSHKGLWQYMAEVFLLWCRRGVDGFRCDAGYMIPVPAWKYITAVVRRQFPDTIFLLEGLGGKISVSRDILNIANLNWTYSELFQNYDRAQIEDYLPGALKIASEDGVMIHFAETHDNNRLAGQSETYARMRTALSALCSQHGGFGFANGVEWFATEKINVHDSNSLNWGSERNQVELIRRLNVLLKNHPAFHDSVDISMVEEGEGNFIAVLRCHIPSGKRVLVVANLDVEMDSAGYWNPRGTKMYGGAYIDLISGNEITVIESEGMCSCKLNPGQVLCLSTDRGEFEQLNLSARQNSALPGRLISQCLRAKALDVHRFYNGIDVPDNFDPDRAAMELAKDPVEFCRYLNTFSEEPRVITWRWPNDLKREVMLPPGHFLLVRSSSSFRAKIVDKAFDNEIVLACEEGLPCKDESYCALFSPLPSPDSPLSLNLNLAVFTPGRCEHADAHLLFLPKGEEAYVKRRFSRTELLSRPLLLLGTNGRGGMLRTHVSLGRLNSKYDALLAANLNPHYPEDRWIMLSRCRAWIVFQGYSMQINDDCLDSFSYDDNYHGYWRYHIPCGQGQHILLTISMKMVQDENAIRISFYRHKAVKTKSQLADSKEIRIILRPDVEDRNFHATVKAYTGPEKTWPESVNCHGDGFIFAPADDRTIQVRMSKGTFVSEPEWQYMVHHPTDAERGMDPNSDLFSPGYFSTLLRGDETVSLHASVTCSKKDFPIEWQEPPHDIKNPDFGFNADPKLYEALVPAIKSFVVKREELHTVIAGYPWFLDWGRDTLIFVRGLIAAGKTETSKAILEQFGRYEDHGTIPNMIRGDDARNRDTSDAPLWFFVACSDLINAERNESFLDTDCWGRTIRNVLISIARSVIAGTPNGIRMDSDSGLVFSPTHFTWMDTNHPLGTPREGYPIEIQALWHFALSFLAHIDDVKNKDFWHDKASLVQQSILDLFLLEKQGFLSDCLHARPYEPAVKADPDDALRPNQLFALTMGAIEDTSVCRKIVSACEELIIPGAIRSLADRDVSYPLPVIHHGETINNPNSPYHGIYAGDEDTHRKPAYHNGTAWTWVFPSFCEAWVRAYGNEGKETALAWLASSTMHLNNGCAGHVPEILDGDYPHMQRGCDAQAWGVSELLRVWLAIKDKP